VELGSTDQAFHSPRMPYTVGLLGSMPSLETQGGRLRPIPGSPPSLINLPPGCPFTPRCPLRTEVCDRSEPPLAPTDRPEHTAACHHWDQVAEKQDPTLLFRAEGSPVL
jgi:peptide/nickel transport system ATP-binding protein